MGLPGQLIQCPQSILPTAPTPESYGKVPKQETQMARITKIAIHFIGSKWFPLWKALHKIQNTVQSAFAFSLE